MILTFTHISKPEYKGKPLYVLNKTKGNNRGPVTFTCPKTNGSGVDSVIVADTWLPINLIEQMPWERLIDSMGFRRAVGAKILVIVDEQEALDLMGQSGADAEMTRVTNIHYGFSESEEEDSDLGATISGSDQGLNATEAKVLTILGKVEEQGEVSVINSFRTIADELENVNLKAIYQYAKQHGYKSLMKWAKENRK